MLVNECPNGSLFQGSINRCGFVELYPLTWHEYAVESEPVEWGL